MQSCNRLARPFQARDEPLDVGVVVVEMGRDPKPFAAKAKMDVLGFQPLLHSLRNPTGEPHREIMGSSNPRRQRVQASGAPAISAAGSQLAAGLGHVVDTPF